MPAACALGTPERAPSGVPERPISGDALPLARVLAAWAKARRPALCVMTMSNCRYNATTSALRTKQHQTALGDLWAQGLRSFWALQRQRQG